MLLSWASCSMGLFLWSWRMKMKLKMKPKLWFFALLLFVACLRIRLDFVKV